MDLHYSITSDDLIKLEDLQNLFFRTILHVPISCPKPSFCWETATLQMKCRIWYKKLMLYKYLQNLYENSLGNKIFEEQNKIKFPGLLNECIEISKEIKLYDELQNK